MKERFQEHLKKEFPQQQAAIDEIIGNNHPNQIIEPVTKEKIQRNIGAKKNRKAPGPGTISADVF